MLADPLAAGRSALLAEGAALSTGAALVDRAESPLVSDFSAGAGTISATGAETVAGGTAFVGMLETSGAGGVWLATRFLCTDSSMARRTAELTPWFFMAMSTSPEMSKSV